jgi:hypothetical protein
MKKVQCPTFFIFIVNLLLKKGKLKLPTAIGIAKN